MTGLGAWATEPNMPTPDLPLSESCASLIILLSFYHSRHVRSPHSTYTTILTTQGPSQIYTLFSLVTATNFKGSSTSSRCESPTLASRRRTRPASALLPSYTTGEVSYLLYKVSLLFYKASLNFCSSRHHFSTPSVQLSNTPRLSHLDFSSDTRNNDHGRRS